MIRFRAHLFTVPSRRMRRLLLGLVLLLAAAPAAAQKTRSPAADSSHTYELREVTVVPRPVNVADLRRALQETYPAQLRDSVVDGQVDVRFRVDAQGMPQDLTITRSTHAPFDAPTLEAVRKLRFSPAEVDGKPVAVWVVLPIQWSVSDPGS